MPKVLLFHIYPVNNWKAVTESLLSQVPHEDIFVHVSLPEMFVEGKETIEAHLKLFTKIRRIFYSPNSFHAEVDAMHVFMREVDFSRYDILTYMHTKGVTKPGEQNIQDWTELMRYFVIDKMAICLSAFHRGYLIYGVNCTMVSPADKDFTGARFFYAGNFVSVNLTKGMIDKLRTTPLLNGYYGLEGFWGKLCDARYAYNAFHSRINHYLTPFPGRYYKARINRAIYSLKAQSYQRYYQLKQYFSAK